MFGLIDGNNFYVSCERAFDPTLIGKPVIVLSNNDGCAIARSAEAKKLGIKMGEVWHLSKRRPEFQGVIAKSSNYPLYGDVSRRVYEVLTEHFNRVEPYSIDEMFLDLTQFARVDYCRRVRDRVRKVTKIPTCVGIGPTKTLAKLANKRAKSEPSMGGVCDFSDDATRRQAFEEMPISEIWGVGGASETKLNNAGIFTVQQFANLPSASVRKLMTVTGQRTHAELLGVSCMPLTMAPGQRQTVAVTRMFGRPIEEWEEMREALAAYASRGAEKVRQHGLTAGAMQVFMHTSPHTGEWYSGQRAFGIEPTSDSVSIIRQVTAAGRSMWQPGFRYQKAGVILLDLQTEMTGNLLPTTDTVRSEKLMTALDGLNQRFGRGTIRPGGIRKVTPWSTRAANRSPSYTTRLSDLMEVRA